MIPSAEQYPFISRQPSLGAASLFPFLPIRFTLKQETVETMGLLDSAASVNVLPYDVGQQLGAVWNEQTRAVHLTGNLGKEEARGLLVLATVGGFPPVRLGFAWTKTNSIPVILGQVNFFMEFDVCLFRSRSAFEIKPR